MAKESIQYKINVHGLPLIITEQILDIRALDPGTSGVDKTVGIILTALPGFIRNCS